MLSVSGNRSLSPHLARIMPQNIIGVALAANKKDELTCREAGK
jgi:hypothetical protein